MKNRELEGSEHGAGHPASPEPSAGLLEFCPLVKGDYLALEMSASTRFQLLRGNDQDI